jgi:hypothetical protein
VHLVSGGKRTLEELEDDLVIIDYEEGGLTLTRDHGGSSLAERTGSNPLNGVAVSIYHRTLFLIAACHVRVARSKR